MSSIIDNFVEVNIKRHQTSGTAGIYNTAVYVGPAPSGSQASTNEYYAKNGSASGAGTKADPKAPPTGDALITAFFANGGQLLHKVSADLITTTATGSAWEDVDVIPLDEIVTFKANGASPAAWPGQTFTYPTGKYQKIFIIPVNSTAAYSGTPSGVLAKYTTNVANCTSIAAAAAYFTNIKIANIDSVKDYAFTVESDIATTDYAAITNTTVSACITNNLNCNAKIAGKIRNIGGNDVAGEGVTNLFMRIVLQQELANAIFETIAKKIKYDDSGKAQLSATVARVMQTFINDGYVNTKKIWTDNDLYIDEELVIATNTPLVGGYVLHFSPYNSVTDAEKQSGVFPTITLIYGDFIGIRKVTISGEVF